MCHHDSFLLCESIENKSQERWNKVTHISLASACSLILTFALIGYITFTGSSQGDIFENFCSSDDLANIAKFLFTLKIMLTYPIECFVVREVR